MVSKNIPSQRALVLQGGGSIGAYEAGVFNVLYYWIKKDLQDKNENIFDIVAGTSIGAINGAILVSHVQENNTWEGTTSHLLKFWDDISSTPDVSNWWPFWHNWPLAWDENNWMDVWNQRHLDNPTAATGEAARRYFSAKENILSGSENMFSKPQRIYDDRFFDDFGIPSNIWYTYDNRPLRKSIIKNVNFPIATSYYNDKKQPIKQPRLLIVSVDVEEAETVVFDSYAKKDGSRNTEYGYDQKSKKYIQKIQYDEGLMVEHVMASASVPIHYDYTFVPIRYEYNISDEERENRLRFDLKQQSQDNIKNYGRFWDGGILSNTPLRDLIQSHQDYWTEVEDVVEIPDLEVYIVDVWPWMEKGNYPIRPDYDSVIDRKNGLVYQDKTPYDEKVANIISDYYNLTKELLNLAEKKATADEIKNILDKTGKSLHHTGTKRQYRSLLEDRFEIKKLIRIERSGDPDDISNKWCDSSKRTKDLLLRQGVEDALKTLVDDLKINNKIPEVALQLDKFINIIKIEKGTDSGMLIEIAEKTKNKLQADPIAD
jgi:predicted acylesterase/phospholipase RssA